MERRVLRRAADQALLMSMAQRQDSAGQPGGPADRDFQYKRAEPVDTWDAYDPEPRTEPIPVAHVEEFAAPIADVAPPFEIVDAPAEPADVYDLVPEHVDGPPIENIDPTPLPAPAADRWDDRDDALPSVEPTPLRARRAAAAYVAPHLDFALAEQEPWYRGKPTAMLLVAAVVGAVLCAGWLVLRSPSTTAEQPAVEATTSAAPTPTTGQPTAASVPIPPPAPPPPPPPPPVAAQPTYSAPQRQYSPRYSEPTPAEKPRVDVTRAPMSVAPVPKPVPGSDHNLPGEAPGEQPRRHGCFGWC